MELDRLGLSLLAWVVGLIIFEGWYYTTAIELNIEKNSKIERMNYEFKSVNRNKN